MSTNRTETAAAALASLDISAYHAEDRGVNYVGTGNYNYRRDRAMLLVLAEIATGIERIASCLEETAERAPRRPLT